MHNFSRSQRIFIEYLGLMYELDIYPEVQWSRVYQARTYQTKTLHNPEYLTESAFVNKTSEANFSFTAPVGLTNTITPILFELCVPDVSTLMMPAFNLYAMLDNDLYKLEGCIIESQVLNLAVTQIITMSISGSAAKMTQITGSLPTVTNPITRQYSIIHGTTVTLGGSIITDIAALALETSNTVSWLENKTIHNAGTVPNPSDVILQSRRISGSFTEFLTENNKLSQQDYSNSMSLDILLKCSQNRNIQTTLPSIEYTRRISTGTPLVTRIYDFSANSNPSNFNKITYS